MTEAKLKSFRQSSNEQARLPFVLLACEGSHEHLRRYPNDFKSVVSDLGFQVLRLDLSEFSYSGATNQLRIEDVPERLRITTSEKDVEIVVIHVMESLPGPERLHVHGKVRYISCLVGNPPYIEGDDWLTQAIQFDEVWVDPGTANGDIYVSRHPSGFKIPKVSEIGGFIFNNLTTAERHQYRG